MSPVASEIRRHRASEPWTYAALERRQREIAARVREGKPGVLLMSELAPVVTYGRRTDVVRDLPSDLSARLDVLPVDRGGYATYHGPGQWVAFPVDRLSRLAGDTRAVRRAVEGLCQAALDVARPYRPDACIQEGARLGVWSAAAGGKLASVGIKIERGVLLHGLALNVCAADGEFQGIRPCGLDARAGYLFSEPPPSDAENSFMRVGKALETAIFSLFWRNNESAIRMPVALNSN